MAVSTPSPGRRRAVDLETLLVWAIRVQKAEDDTAAWFEAETVVYNAQRAGISHRGITVEFCRPSADGCATVLQRHTVGTVIDGGGATWGIRPRLHPDADLVYEAVERMPLHERGLLLQHARQAGRPDWLPLAQPMVKMKRPGETRGRYQHVVSERWEPAPRRSEIAELYFQRGISLFDPDGGKRLPREEHGFRFRDLDDAGRMLLVRWCPLEPDHSAAEVAEVNRIYARWHRAMAALLELLDAAPLRDHVLTGFAAPANPWDYNP